MIKIRPADASDLDFVYTCVNTLEETVFDRETFGRLYKEVVGSPGRFLFVIEHNDEEMGYMSLYVQPLLHHNGKVAEIQELIILPEFRSNGAGHLAMEFAKEFAKEEGCVLLELASSMKREDAHRFYTNNGFMRSHYKFTFEL